MTCIVAYKGVNSIFMGGDSAGISGDNIAYRMDAKVFIKEDKMIFGFMGSFRMGQILRFHLKIPEQKVEDDFEYLCTDFVDELTKTLEKKGFGNMKDGRKNGGTFLLGYKNNIYTIHNDYQVAINREPYMAIGSGEEYAKGCLYCGHLNKKQDPKTKVHYALSAAAYHSSWVSPPYIIEELKYIKTQLT